MISAARVCSATDHVVAGEKHKFWLMDTVSEDERALFMDRPPIGGNDFKWKVTPNCQGLAQDRRTTSFSYLRDSHAYIPCDCPPKSRQKLVASIQSDATEVMSSEPSLVWKILIGTDSRYRTPLQLTAGGNRSRCGCGHRRSC